MEELRLGNDVRFAGIVENEELAHLYRGALGFIFPSLYEGFGLPPLEAMACGTPVLTSNVCSLPEVVGKAGILVDPLNVEAIADGIRRLVENADMRASLRRSGLQRAQEFSWDQTARKTADVLDQVLATTRDS